MTMALLLALSAGVKAQYVTYNHDESVQNQVTIQEIGSGERQLRQIEKYGIILTSWKRKTIQHTSRRCSP